MWFHTDAPRQVDHMGYEEALRSIYWKRIMAKVGVWSYQSESVTFTKSHLYT